MENISVAKRYAEAIYDIAEKNNEVFDVFEMLSILLEHISNDNDFKKFLTYPTITKEEKKELIFKIYSDLKNKPLEILDYLIEKDRLLNIKEILSEYNKIYYEKHKKLVVTAIFPKELTEEQKIKLKKNLEQSNKKEVIIHYQIDESLIGGGIIKINDKIIDGSIKSQVNNLKL